MSKLAYLNNVYGLAGIERLKVINQYFFNFLEALLPPIIIFKLSYTKNLLSDEQFLRLKKLSKVEQIEIIEREGIEVNNSDWFDLHIVDSIEDRIICQ